MARKKERASMKTVDEFISSLPKEKQEIMQRVRELIKKEVPEAEEAMGYGVPAFKLNGKYLVYYAVFKEHFGLYPTPETIEFFKDELKDYKQSKGAVQFPLAKPLPMELIKKIVKYREEKIK